MNRPRSGGPRVISGDLLDVVGVVRGGVKVYRGAASSARAYVEADRSRIDDYYLAGGTGRALRFGASPADVVQDLGVLDGDGYGSGWLAAIR